MSLSAEKKQSIPHKNRPDKRWMLIIISVSLLLLATWMAISTQNSYALIPRDLLVTPSLTPPATATIISTNKPMPSNTYAVTATSTNKLIPSNIAHATATSTSQPTATNTATSTSHPEVQGKVAGYFVNLRTGPGMNYTVVRKLTYREPLIVLGRLSDNTWLYVKTSDNREGWIKTTWVESGIDLDDQAIKTPSPPKTTVRVTGDSVNLRAGPGTNYLKIRKLAYGELLMLNGRLSDNTWLYITTSDGQEGWIKKTWVEIAENYKDINYQPIITPPPTYTSTPVILTNIEGRWIDIDLSEQRLYAYEGTKLVASFLVSTGIAKYPTDPGQYHINTKLRYSDMRGDDYFLPDVPFTMYYFGDFSIHGTYWHHSFGTPMSHGCVNMDTKDAEWLYNWASVGTLVNIHY